MRTISKLLLVLSLVCSLTVLTFERTSASEQTGITLSPATLTLDLQPKTTGQTATFDIINHYQTPVTLRFAFDRAIADTTTGPGPPPGLSVAQPELTLSPGQTARQTVALQDSPQLQPGSQRADLVVAVVGGQSSTVAISPSIRMPIIIVKLDGAVSAVTFKHFDLGALRLTTPQTLTATIGNSGNTITIPRGTVTISDTISGSAVSRGALNISSVAISPGSSQPLTSTLYKVHNPILPGIYRVSLDYGLGGGRAVKHASQTYIYIAWWHYGILAGAVVLAFLLRKHSVQRLHTKRRAALRRAVA